MDKSNLLNKDWLNQKYIVENLSIREIAAILHCGSTTVNRYIKKYSIKKSILFSRNKHNITKELLETLYIKEKKSQYEIASVFGVQQAYISYYMRKFEIKVRTYEENFSGEKHPRYGKSNKWGYHTAEHRKRMSERFSGKNNPMFGKKLSPQTKELLSIMFSGENNPMFGVRGKDAPGYKFPEERIKPLYQQIRTCLKYSLWRTQCFERDQYTCKICFNNTGNNLVVHHIKQFSKIIKEQNIKILEEAQLCDDLWDINNGITICELCHKKFHLNNPKINTNKGN